MHQPGRRHVRQLGDRIRNSASDRHAGDVAIRRELVGPSSAFRLDVVVVALEHQVSDAPDVDVGYHADKTASLRSVNL